MLWKGARKIRKREQKALTLGRVVLNLFVVEY